MAVRKPFSEEALPENEPEKGHWIVTGSHAEEGSNGAVTIYDVEFKPTPIDPEFEREILGETGFKFMRALMQHLPPFASSRRD